MNWLQDEELEELTEFLTPSTVGENEETTGRFSITDLSTLNWTLRKLSSLDQKRLEEVNLANAELERINMWFAKQDITYQASKNFLERLIKEYAKQQRVINPKWKGNKTPYGAIGLRKQTKWDYGDEDSLVEYLEKDFSFLVKVEKTPMKAEIKKDFTAIDGKAVNKLTGEILPGITISELEPIVTIKLEG